MTNLQGNLAVTLFAVGGVCCIAKGACLLTAVLIVDLVTRFNWSPDKPLPFSPVLFCVALIVGGVGLCTAASALKKGGNNANG